MAQKRRSSEAAGRTTPSKAEAPGPKTSNHSPVVRIVAIVAIVMMIVTLATGLIAVFAG